MAQYIFFIWDGKPNNMVKVCLQSLRFYNKLCTILFYYLDSSIPEKYKKWNIKFILLENKKWKNRRMCHKIELIKKQVECLTKAR